MAKAKVSAAKPAASALAGLGPLLTAAAAPHRAYLAGLGVPPIWVTMAEIFTAIFLAVYLLSRTCLTRVITKRSPSVGKQGAAHVYAPGRWLADAETNPSKHHAEVFILRYSACWIVSVVVVIATAAYESWGKWGYMSYCGACAAPAVLYPLMFPLRGDVGRPLRDWYILKANVWIGVFSFIGNYWYTHYFYCVLRANYTFDAHRLNDVPIALYLMTHAYFMFYHVLSNAALRKIRSRYRPGRGRFAFECGAIAAMSYLTAFMESLTICGFPVLLVRGQGHGVHAGQRVLRHLLPRLFPDVPQGGRGREGGWQGAERGAREGAARGGGGRDGWSDDASRRVLGGDGQRDGGAVHAGFRSSVPRHRLQDARGRTLTARESKARR